WLLLRPIEAYPFPLGIRIERGRKRLVGHPAEIDPPTDDRFGRVERDDVGRLVATLRRPKQPLRPELDLNRHVDGCVERIERNYASLGKIGLEPSCQMQTASAA